MNKKYITPYSLLLTPSRRRREGFTLIEIIVALGGMAVLVIAATSFLFAIFSQRDQALTESIVAEQSETIFTTLASAIRSAVSIQVLDAGKRLELTGGQECFTFVWDDFDQEINFGRTTGSSCTPPASAGNRLSSQLSQIESANFTLLDPDDSSRTVGLDITIGAYRPLWNVSKQFNRAFVNLIDE